MRYYPTEQLANRMLSWHGGMSSTLYSCGSTMLAEHPVTREQLESAAGELASCKPHGHSDTVHLTQTVHMLTNYMKFRDAFPDEYPNG